MQPANHLLLQKEGGLKATVGVGNECTLVGIGTFQINTFLAQLLLPGKCHD